MQPKRPKARWPREKSFRLSGWFRFPEGTTVQCSYQVMERAPGVIDVMVWPLNSFSLWLSNYEKAGGVLMDATEKIVSIPAPKPKKEPPT